MRLIDPMGLKESLAISSILMDGKTLEQIIDEQPTIEPERPTGRWIVEPGIGCKCNRCGFDIGNDLDWMEYVNYCPSCGAKMEVEHE